MWHLRFGSEPLEDNRLAAAAADGNEEALATLVERYRRYIYTIAYKIALDPDNALDITQNVFVRLVEKIATFNGHGPFRAWLGTMTSREALSYLRRPSRRETATEPEILTSLADERADGQTRDPREALDVAHRRRVVEATMACLPPQQRAIFALRFREDMGPKEIAERLSIPAQQVRSQLHRAIARIRDAIAEKRV